MDFQSLIPQAWLVSVMTATAIAVKTLLWLRGEQRNTRGYNNTRDNTRTLTLVEEQQKDLHEMMGLLRTQQAADREDRDALKSMTTDLGRMTAALDRMVGQVTAISAGVQIIQRDIESHAAAAGKAMEQVADIHQALVARQLQ